MTMLIVIGRTDATSNELIDAAEQLARAGDWSIRTVLLQDDGLNAGGDTLPTTPVGGETETLSSDAVVSLSLATSSSGVTCVAAGVDASGDPDSLALRLLAAPSVPLLLVRSGLRSPRTLRSLLVPLKGSPRASAAMLFVESTLCGPDREIVVLAVAGGALPSEPGSFPVPRLIDQEQYEWSDWRDEFSRRFTGSMEGCEHRVKVAIGEPADAILEEAREIDADLIVLAWRGRFVGGHGETVRRLIAVAPCPVLVVSPDLASDV
ncbi:MAG: universal stress protein [Thermoleophilia bacterium]